MTQVLAMDCEMVGVGPDGDRSVLARVCIINNYGSVLLDTHVTPGERVTDYRTRVSGIRAADLRGAAKLQEVQRQVAALVKGRTLVGHALKNDLAVLMLSHPKSDTRDTAHYPPLMSAPPGGGKLRSQPLKALAAKELGLAIQQGEHSPVDDARAALYIYHKRRKEWERAIKTGSIKALRHQLGTGKRQPTHSELAANDMMSDL